MEIKNHLNNMEKRQIHRCIIITAAIFIFSVILGYFSAVFFPAESLRKVRDVQESFSFAKDFNLFFIFLFIFINNIVKAFFAVLLGIFFGIVPLVFMFVNGQIIGLVSQVMQAKVGLFYVILSLFPHGIIEIPAIVIASAYGLWLGYKFFRRIVYGEPILLFVDFAFKKFFTLVVPMLFVAAIVEAFLTPQILSIFYQG